MPIPKQHELEAKQAMEKADWECWKKIEERFKKITDHFYLIWMAMTKKILGEKKGYDRDGMTNFPNMETR